MASSSNWDPSQLTAPNWDPSQLPAPVRRALVRCHRYNMDARSVSNALNALKDCLGVVPIVGVVIAALGYIAASALQAGENAELEQENAKLAATVKVNLQRLIDMGSNQVSEEFYEESAVKLCGVLFALAAQQSRKKRWYDCPLACACANCDKATLDQQSSKLREILSDIRGEVEGIIARRTPHPANVPPSVPVHDSLVHRRQKVMSFLCGGRDSDLLRAVGIYGLGGLGKTTVMQAVEAEIRNLKTHRIAYVTVGEDLSNKSLLVVQSDIVYQLNGKKEEYQSPEHGINGLKQCMESLGQACSIFIDNVWDVKDLKALLPKKLGNVMPPSSYIMASSRHKDVVDELDKLCLNPQKKVHEYFAYSPGLLKHEESISVFVQYASERGFELLPKHKQVVDTIVPLCCGLPLLLKVYGSHFDSDQKIEEEWEGLKKRLEAAQDMEDAEERTFEMLKTSISCFEAEAFQDAFADVVLFYSEYFTAGEIKHMLDEDNYLSKMENRSLVSLVRKERYRFGSYDGVKIEVRVEVMVHDVLRAIAKQMPDKHRIWRGHNGWEVLPESMMSQLRYLEVSGLRSIEDLPSTQNMFGELRTLSLSTIETRGDPLLPPWVTHSKKLRCLSLHNIPWESFANGELPPQLRRLRIHYDRSSNTEMQPFCDNIQTLTQLKALELHNCMHEGIPEWIEHFKDLTRLSITTTSHAVGGLEEVGGSIGALTKLEEIDLSGNPRLRTVSGAIGRLVKLQRLDLSHHPHLEGLPDEVADMSSLLELRLTYCYRITALPRLPTSLNTLFIHTLSALAELPDNFSEVTSLRKIEVNFCDSLAEVPPSLVRLPFLEKLTLWFCKALAKLPDDFSQATSLRKIVVSNCDSLAELPPSLMRLPYLEELTLDGCEALARLPDDFSQGTSLRMIDVRKCRSLAELPPSLVQLPYLEELKLGGCNALARLPDNFSQATSLRKIDFSGGCDSLAELPPSLVRLPSLKELELQGCKALGKLPDDFSKATSLRKIDVSGCENLAELPPSLVRLSSLEELKCKGCKALLKLPDDFSQATSLRKIDVRECHRLVELPLSLVQLPSLEVLILWWCKALARLPYDFSQATCLREIDIRECYNLVELPPSVVRLPYLKELTLCDFRALEELPDDFSQATSLRKIDVSGCNSLAELPPSLVRLPYLEEMKLWHCKALANLPNDFSRATSLRKIDLSFCDNLAELPPSLVRLPSLEELTLYGCKALVELPDDFSQATSLRKIDLRSCSSLAEPPASLMQLRSLEVLFVAESRPAPPTRRNASFDASLNNIRSFQFL